MSPIRLPDINKTYNEYYAARGQLLLPIPYSLQKPMSLPPPPPPRDPYSLQRPISPPEGAA